MYEWWQSLNMLYMWAGSLSVSRCNRWCRCSRVMVMLMCSLSWTHAPTLTHNHCLHVGNTTRQHRNTRSGLINANEFFHNEDYLRFLVHPIKPCSKILFIQVFFCDRCQHPAGGTSVRETGPSLSLCCDASFFSPPFFCLFVFLLQLHRMESLQAEKCSNIQVTWWKQAHLPSHTPGSAHKHGLRCTRNDRKSSCGCFVFFCFL